MGKGYFMSEYFQNYQFPNKFLTLLRYLFKFIILLISSYTIYLL